jgi:hypothetical protein
MNSFICMYQYIELSINMINEADILWKVTQMDRQHESRV